MPMAPQAESSLRRTTDQFPVTEFLLFRHGRRMTRRFLRRIPTARGRLAAGALPAAMRLLCVVGVFWALALAAFAFSTYAQTKSTILQVLRVSGQNRARQQTRLFTQSEARSRELLAAWQSGEGAGALPAHPPWRVLPVAGPPAPVATRADRPVIHTLLHDPYLDTFRFVAGEGVAIHATGEPDNDALARRRDELVRLARSSASPGVRWSEPVYDRALPGWRLTVAAVDRDVHGRLVMAGLGLHLDRAQFPAPLPEATPVLLSRGGKAALLDGEPAKQPELRQAIATACRDDAVPERIGRFFVVNGTLPGPGLRWLTLYPVHGVARSAWSATFSNLPVTIVLLSALTFVALRLFDPRRNASGPARAGDAARAEMPDGEPPADCGEPGPRAAATSRPAQASSPPGPVGQAALPRDADHRRLQRRVRLLERSLRQAGQMPALAATPGQPVRRQAPAPMPASRSSGDGPASPAMPAASCAASTPVNCALEVLVVDDVHSNREIIGEMLRLLGHRAQLAASGEEALAMGRRRAFDLVLMDLNMSGIGGRDTANAWRAPDSAMRDPQTMIVAFTAADTRGEDTDATDSVFHAVLGKPVMIEALSNIILRAAAYQRARGIAVRPACDDASQACRPVSAPPGVGRELAALADAAIGHLASGATEEVGACLHAIKGCAGIAGLDEFADAAAALERMARTAPARTMRDLRDLRARLAHLESCDEALSDT
jgi:CheY-like chemotaxis protein